MEKVETSLPPTPQVISPPVPSLQQLALAWLGGLAAIAAVAFLSTASGAPLVLGSFGASCVLIFGFPDSPFSQPRNVIGGHLLASATGMVFYALFGATWWSMALALATTITVMQVTRTVHPPAGSNPLIIMLTTPSWSFLLTPTLLGVLILQTVAVLYHRTISKRAYPKYWI